MNRYLLTQKLFKHIRHFFFRLAWLEWPKIQGFFWAISVLFRQFQAYRRRTRRTPNLPVPFILIASITQQCNLRCKGCYAQDTTASTAPALTSADYQRIFRDAAELGVGMLFLAGGEPLLRMDVVGLAKSFPRLLFLVFTNGLHLPQLIAEFKNSPRAVIPIISIEGDAPDTDKRRGPGVAKSLEADLPLLTQHGMFWGLSITLTRFNTYVLEENFLWPWIAKGCRVFFFIDYVPKDSTTADWVLTPAEHTDMLGRLAKLERRLPALFISLPGDETLFSGCLAAGRGFIHLAADGRLEPCPFAPFSDRNVKDMPLEVALRSPLLATLRHAHPQLIEGHGGCTLWANRDHVASLLQQSSPTPGHE